MAHLEINNILYLKKAMNVDKYRPRGCAHPCPPSVTPLLAAPR